MRERRMTPEQRAKEMLVSFFAVLLALQKPHWGAARIAREAPKYARAWRCGAYWTVKP